MTEGSNTGKGYRVHNGEVWIGSDADFSRALEDQSSGYWRHLHEKTDWVQRDGSQNPNGKQFGSRLNGVRPIVPQGARPDHFVQIINGSVMWVGPSNDSVTSCMKKEDPGSSHESSSVVESRASEKPKSFQLSDDGNHAHHYIYEEPHGEKSEGYCKHCGKGVFHRNWSSASDFLTNADHRFAEVI